MKDIKAEYEDEENREKLRGKKAQTVSYLASKLARFRKATKRESIVVYDEGEQDKKPTKEEPDETGVAIEMTTGKSDEDKSEKELLLQLLRKIENLERKVEALEKSK